MSTTPLQQQLAAFEQQRAGFWERVTGTAGLVQGDQLLLQALQVISQQLSDLPAAVQGKGAGAPGLSGVAAPLDISLSFPLDPERLNELLAVVPELRGYIADSVVQFATAVPANSSVTISIPRPPGYVAILMAPLQFDGTYVGANVTAQVSVDGNNVIGPQGFVIGPSGGIVAGQYTVAQTTGVQIVLTNPSATAATIYFFGQVRVMSQPFYQNVYAPLHSASYRAVKAAFGITF